jgi:hypothetical protein
MNCRGSGVGVKALGPRSGARMRGLDSDPTSATLWESGECPSLHFTPSQIADKTAIPELRRNEQPSEQPPTKMASRFREAILPIRLLESWCREGGSNPHEVALGGF